MSVEIFPDIAVLDSETEVTLTWSRRIRFAYKKRAVVTADLVYGGEWDGYSLEVHDIEIESDDPTDYRDLPEEVQEWADNLTSGPLWVLDKMTA